MNAEIDFSPIIPYLLKSTYGVIFICVLALFASIIFGMYFLIKSGLLTSIREFHEFKSSKIDAYIKTQKKFLNDPDFSECKDEIAYNLKLAKLEKLLNFKHHDIDLLLYILSCKNKDRAIRLYKSSKQFLKKDDASHTYVLIEKWTHKKINSKYKWGSFLYFGIIAISLFPALWMGYLLIKNGVSLREVPSSFYIAQVKLLLMAFVIAVLVLINMVRPMKAKTFLELEKISPTE
ncbi:hypothetical protein [Acinetobacter sp. ANC 5502]